MSEPETVSLLSEAQTIASLKRQVEHLHGAGGGGTSDGMLERIVRLEKQGDQLVKDVGDLRVDVAALKENVRHLPTKEDLGARLRTYLTIAVAIIGVMIGAATFALKVVTG